MEPTIGLKNGKPVIALGSPEDSTIAKGTKDTKEIGEIFVTFVSFVPSWLVLRG